MSSLPTGLTLEQDYVTVPGQRFALVSFVGPDQPQKNEKLGMKIRGVFATEDEARAHVKRIQDSGDRSVDILLMEMYKWCVVPPDPMMIENHEYQEEYLNDLMTNFAESQRAAKQHFEERKRLVREETIDKHLEPHERIPRPEHPPKFEVDPATGATAVLEAMDSQPGTSRVT